MDTVISVGIEDFQKQRIYKKTSLKKETDRLSVASSVSFYYPQSLILLTGKLYMLYMLTMVQFKKIKNHYKY
jgi:hypothetical protein